MISRKDSHQLHWLRQVLAGLTATTLLLISGAVMADWVFVEMEGIKGESTDKTHQEAINALSWNWGMTQPASFHIGGGGGAGKVNIQDLSFTHYLDSASPALMHYCATGKHIAEVKIFVRSLGDRPVEYLQITLKKVLVTSVETSGVADPGVRPIENVSLNFAEVNFEYATQKVDGRMLNLTPFKWNIVENRPQ